MRLARHAIERNNPEADADELAVKFVTHCYGAALGDAFRHDLEARRRQRQP
jgi:hypothetical protein